MPYNKLLTNLASSSRTGEYWPSVVLYGPRCARSVLPRPRANIPRYGPRARLVRGYYSGAPAARRAARRSPIIIEKGTTRMHRNGNPCNSFLMVKMASGMDHGRVRPTTTTNDVAQHGGHPANTKSCNLGLQHISLILDMHIMCN